MGSFGTNLGPSGSYREDVVLQVLGQSNKYWWYTLSSGGRVDFILPPYCLFVSMGQLGTIVALLQGNSGPFQGHQQQLVKGQLNAISSTLLAVYSSKAVSNACFQGEGQFLFIGISSSKRG